MFHASRHWLKSRHPLARVAAAAIAVVVVAVLLVLGLAVFALLVVGGAAFMAVRALRRAHGGAAAAPAPAAPAEATGTIEGEFVVVREAGPRDGTPRPV